MLILNAILLSEKNPLKIKTSYTRTCILLTSVFMAAGCQPDQEDWELESSSYNDLCLGGCPPVKSGNTLLKRKVYNLSNNPRTKFADWVSYRVTPSSIGSGKNRVWQADPDLKAGTTLEPSDYTGASADLDTDRGHQVPLGSFTGTSYWKETNYLSNITPQSKSLNQGAWNKLEGEVREMTKSRRKSTWVLTGPIYQYYFGKLPKADEYHRIPSGYWKVIAIIEGNQAYTVAFAFDQDIDREADFCDQIVPLRAIEDEINLALMDKANIQNQIDSQRVAEKLGCE